jgi:hypothetical protein
VYLFTNESLAFWPDLSHANNEVGLVLFATPLSCFSIIILLIEYLNYFYVGLSVALEFF